MRGKEAVGVRGESISQGEGGGKNQSGESGRELRERE